MSIDRNRRFELEALEPRVLLSADMAALPISDPGGGFSQAVVEDSTVQQSVDATGSINYDPAAQIRDIFGVAEQKDAVTDRSEAEPDSADPADNDLATAAEESSQIGGVNRIGDIPQGAQSTLQATDAESTSPFPGQLTETLTAANGPPILTDSLENSASPLLVITSDS